MSLQPAIQHLLNQVGAVSGIRNAADYPPESTNVFPFVIAYPERGNFQFEPYLIFKGLHTIALEVYFNRSDLPKAIELMTPFVKSVSDVVKTDPTLGGHVDTVVADQNTKMEYEVKFQSYGKTPTVSIKFSIVVKIRE